MALSKQIEPQVKFIREYKDSTDKVTSRFRPTPKRKSW
jgi:hypothetical protein